MIVIERPPARATPTKAAASQLGPTRAQLKAREEFDLEATLAALPPQFATSATSYQGAAGVRLRPHLVADISDALLREFAKDTLRAGRMSEQYLDALRVVLANQAEAERMGYVLEMNLRVTFAPVGVMRTIVGQMRRAEITFSQQVLLGGGKSQVVQCFASRRHQHESAEAELEYLDRRDEAAALPEPAQANVAEPWGIPEHEVPY